MKGIDIMKVYMVTVYDRFNDKDVKKLFSTIEKIPAYIEEYMKEDLWFEDNINECYDCEYCEYERVPFNEYLKKVVNEGGVDELFYITEMEVE